MEGVPMLDQADCFESVAESEVVPVQRLSSVGAGYFDWFGLAYAPSELYPEAMLRSEAVLWWPEPEERWGGEVETVGRHHE